MKTVSNSLCKVQFSADDKIEMLLRDCHGIEIDRNEEEHNLIIIKRDVVFALTVIIKQMIEEGKIETGRYIANLPDWNFTEKERFELFCDFCKFMNNQGVSSELLNQEWWFQ